MIESPTLRRVFGGKMTLDAFWEQVHRRGAPLIEDTGVPAQPLVTFVFRGHARTRSVVVFGGPAGFDVPRNQMQPCGDTELWFRSYRVPREARAVYELSVDGPLQAPWHMRDLSALGASLGPDPLNRRPLRIVESADEAVTRSLLELPGAPALTYHAARPEVPRGSLRADGIRSELLGNSRTLWTYRPHADHGPARALLIVFDGVAFTRTLPTPTVLDNLIAERRIPPTAALFVDSVGSRRNVELPCNSLFAAFVATELLPWSRQRCGAFEREQTVLAGASYGGLASAFVARAHPQCFGNVLSLSGSYWAKGEEDDRWAWLPRHFEHIERLPLRFYLSIGLFEQGGRLSEDAPEQLGINRRMRDVLRARGYEVTYREYAGGHDYAGWEPCLVEGLTTLL